MDEGLQESGTQQHQKNSKPTKEAAMPNGKTTSDPSAVETRTDECQPS